MKQSNHLGLNLASNPVRNRRLFYLLRSTVLVALVLVSLFSGILFLRYSFKGKSIKNQILQLDQQAHAAQEEGRKYEAGVNDASQKYKGKVDQVNKIIFSKSFPWIEFFSNLENALPDSCYIISLSPKIGGESKIDMTFKVSSPNIQELLNLINNLNALKFHQIQVMSEARDEKGQLISEVSLSYERNI